MEARVKKSTWNDPDIHPCVPVSVLVNLTCAIILQLSVTLLCSTHCYYARDLITMLMKPWSI